MPATAGCNSWLHTVGCYSWLAARSLEAEVDVDNDGGDADEALDALMGNEEVDERTQNAKFARKVKLLVYQKTLPTSCPAAGPPEARVVTVGI